MHIRTLPVGHLKVDYLPISEMIKDAIYMGSTTKLAMLAHTSKYTFSVSYHVSAYVSFCVCMYLRLCVFIFVHLCVVLCSNVMCLPVCHVFV